MPRTKALMGSTQRTIHLLSPYVRRELQRELARLQRGKLECDAEKAGSEQQMRDLTPEHDRQIRNESLERSWMRPGARRQPFTDAAYSILSMNAWPDSRQRAWMEQELERLRL